VFPKVASDQTRRPHFDLKDWQLLIRHLREHIKHGHPAVVRDRTLLVNYVLILANTGIRVGEARILKWRDLQPISNPDDASITNVMLTVKGKTGNREVVARTHEVKKYFGRILELRRADLANPKSDIYQSKDVPSDSYVFCGLDGKPIESFKKSFATLLREAGVEKDSYGQRRSIYSLRHTYATFRLHEGVNQYLLARNMGTSVAMLESFYGHTTNVASAAELTKSRPKRGNYESSKPSSPLGWLAG
jgi:integrase